MESKTYISYDKLSLYDEKIKQYIDDNFAKTSESGDIVIDGEIKAENIPYTVSEVTLLTIPADTMANVIANDIETFTIDSFDYDTKNIVYASYGGKEYASIIQTDTELEFFVANPYVTDGFACVINFGVDAEGNADETKATFINRVLDTENITDLVLTQIVVNTIDSKYFDHDFTVINSINMNRRGNTGVYSTALGSGCVASGDYSFATGLASEATGSSATAVGKGAFATGEAGFATGLMTTAGREAFATGRYSEATGRGSFATGNTVKATANYSVAEGQNTLASATFAHAEGQNTTASKTCAHSEGLYTLASSNYQHVQGKYNAEDTSNVYAHIVGNGTSVSARSNAHTLDWNGNAEFAGDIVAYGCSSTESPISLSNINSLVESLQTEIGDGFEDVTDEEIRALFN